MHADVSPPHRSPIIIFDGVCNLCNSSVQFILRQDTKNQFYFSSLQSDFARELVDSFHLHDRPDSIMLVYGGRLYTESLAVLLICKILGGPWNLMLLFFIIPTFIRNPLYRFIARNRYRWFGKQDQCMIPTPELRARFLEDAVGAE